MGAGYPPLSGSYSRQGCGPKSSRFPNPWKASLAPDKTLGSAPKEAPYIKRPPALAGNRNRVLHGALGERPPCKTACRVFLSRVSLQEQREQYQQQNEKYSLHLAPLLRALRRLFRNLHGTVLRHQSYHARPSARLFALWKKEAESKRDTLNLPIFSFRLVPCCH